MGHKTSDRKLRSIQAGRAAAERKLAGWQWSGKRLKPLRTVEGVLARGGVLKGRCASAECRRYVRIDLHWWARHGLSDTAITTAHEAYRCGRLGCDLTWQPEFYPSGVPVQFLVG